MLTDIYVHSDKEGMWDKGEALGLCDEALRMFRHTACEVKLTLDVDHRTGESKIVGVDGKCVSDEDTPKPKEIKLVKCRFCSNEFRKEEGHVAKITIPLEYSGSIVGENIYVCKHCADKFGRESL